MPCARLRFRSSRRRCGATGLILTKSRDIGSWWTEMHTPLSEIYNGWSLLPIQVLYVPPPPRSPLQCITKSNIRPPSLCRGRRTSPDTKPFHPSEQLQTAPVVCSRPPFPDGSKLCWGHDVLSNPSLPPPGHDRAGRWSLRTVGGNATWDRCVASFSPCHSPSRYLSIIITSGSPSDITAATFEPTS
jgi:hypothetical protein